MSTRTLSQNGQDDQCCRSRIPRRPQCLQSRSPAGSRCCFLSGGTNGGRWVVDDLSFLNPNSAVYHDADHYGIPVPETNVIEDPRRT